MKIWFDKFAEHAAQLMGTPQAFIAAALLCLLWLVTGPFFNFSDTWQLMINTPTTVLTFLAVFILQYTQHKNDPSVHTKLDALIKATHDANNYLIGLEARRLDDIEQIQKEVRGES